MNDVEIHEDELGKGKFKPMSDDESKMTMVMTMTSTARRCVRRFSSSSFLSSPFTCCSLFSLCLPLNSSLSIRLLALAVAFFPCFTTDLPT